jgi:DNA modification methylase
MKAIPDGSVDMILCDLPYGTTACKWDVVIPLEPLWEQYGRTIKKNGAIVLFGSQPFTSVLVTSNLKAFRYEWIWQKNAGSNFAQVRFQPMKEHESVLVFSLEKSTYYPIPQLRAESGAERVKTPVKYETKAEVYGMGDNETVLRITPSTLRCPSSVQKFNRERGFHPTQKPVALLEYLIRTYTNEGETVLDNCMGSGSTGVAAVNLNRRFIGIEKDEKYFEIASKRVKEANSVLLKAA